MDCRALYTRICAQNPADVPLFAHPWWLDAVSAPQGKEWDAVVAVVNGEPVAAMPYQLTRKGPFAAFLMPHLTQVGYLWVAPGADRAQATGLLIDEYVRVMRRHRCLMAQTALYLPPADAEVFRKRGFDVQERVSYRMPFVSAPQDAEPLLHGEKRRAVRKGRSLFAVSQEDNPDEFFDFFTANLQGRGQSPFYSRGLWQTLYRAAASRGSACLFWARRPDGTPAAAVMMAYDDARAYYLVPTFAPDAASQGAMEMLTLHAMEWAAQTGREFDFEGSMVPGIARAYRHFGGVPHGYYFFQKFAHPWIKRLINLAK